jgi:hypothetical protein
MRTFEEERAAFNAACSPSPTSLSMLAIETHFAH